MFGTTIKTTSTKYEMALRNRIHGFKVQMAECAHGGLQISPEGMDQFLAELDALQTMATEMGNELKHHRLNYQYARDKEVQEQARAVLAAANDSKSNVIAWPICARPIGDGR